MPLGKNHKVFEIWDGIIEKTEKKLATWNNIYHLGGTILVNSVLDSLPTYVMYLFSLDKLMKDFLWFGNKEGKGLNLVK